MRTPSVQALFGEKSKSVSPKMSDVGKVWISRKKNFPAPFGAIPGNFLRGPEKIEKMLKCCLFSLVGQWALFNPLHMIHVLF